MRTKFYVYLFEKKERENFYLTYSEWERDFINILDSLDKGEIGYIHLGQNSVYFVKFYEEQKEKNLKLQMALRLKRIGVNPLLFYIPPELLKSYTVFRNLYIPFRVFKEKPSGINFLYLKKIHKLPKGFLYLLKDLGIEAVFSELDENKKVLILKEGNISLPLYNVKSEESNLKFVDYNLYTEKRDKREFFSLDEVLAGLSKKGETVKEPFPFPEEIPVVFEELKKYEQKLRDTSILLNVLNFYESNIQKKFIEDKKIRFYTLFKESKEKIKNEYQELTGFSRFILKDYVEDDDSLLVFNPLPYKREFCFLRNRKLYTVFMNPLSLAIPEKGMDFNKTSDFGYHEKGKFSFRSMEMEIIYSGEFGILKGGIYEEELMEDPFIYGESKYIFSDKKFDFNFFFYQNQNYFSLKGYKTGFKNVGFRFRFKDLKNLFYFSSFEIESLRKEGVYNEIVVISKDNFLIKFSPSIVKFVEGGFIGVFERDCFELFIKKVDKVNYKNMLCFYEFPLFIRGKIKKELPFIFELKTEDTYFIDLEEEGRKLFLYFYNPDEREIRLLFNEKPEEGFVDEFFSRGRIKENIEFKGKWVVIPPKRGFIRAVLVFKTLPLKFF